MVPEIESPLAQAVAAELPLITCTVRDTISLPEVLAHVLGKTPLKWSPSNKGLVKGGIHYMKVPKDLKVDLSYDTIYGEAVAKEATIIFVNPKAPIEQAFHAGELHTPRAMIRKLLIDILDDKDHVETLMPSMGSCTMKEAAELIRLCSYKFNAITPEGLIKTRRAVFQGNRGVTLIDTAQGFYDPPEWLQEWADMEEGNFLAAGNIDPRLIPRGILADGPPGTGKTAGAKWLGKRWNVPVYRLDVAGLKHKYIGDSQENLAAALAQVDHEQPCIMLVDEIEKLFGKGEGESDHSTTSDMLGMTLWWLQEHTSRVLTWMTTNNVKALPPELFREGRIDGIHWFGGLDKSEAPKFAVEILKTFSGWEPVEIGDGIAEQCAELAFSTSTIKASNPPRTSQAAIVQACIHLVKTHDPVGA